MVQLSEELHIEGYTIREAAAWLHVPPRTLRAWQVRCRHPVWEIPVLGRPLLRASLAQRHQVIELLDELGPATGLSTLRACFPALARAELADILRRYRHVWQQSHTELQYRLRWPIVGRVWAMDFTEAPRPIDGRYPYLLAVRDLSSGYQLLWLPVSDLRSAGVEPALAALFAVQGVPLVLKMDNGSAFLAEVVQQFLGQAGVTALFSPPYFPRYNGSIEAGIGSLKTRTEAQAVLGGHPGHWTWNDTAAAQAQANATSRPRGECGPTADDLWRDRLRLVGSERERFQTTLQRCRREAKQDSDQPEQRPGSRPEERALDRQAIRRALVELGYLLFSRRRIPLPIKQQKVTDI